MILTRCATRGWRQGHHLVRKYSSSQNEIKLDKVLVLQKLSRLDLERLRHPHLTQSELKEHLVEKGRDYKSFLKHHDSNKSFQDNVVKVLHRFGIETEIVNRFSYTESNIQWCDVVMPVGGDGTFLLAASRVPDRNKPVIGFNSDPCRSEGHLCLPKQYSSNIQGAVTKLKEGSFRWLYRTRIRTTLCGKDVQHSPTELHEESVKCSVLDQVAEERKRKHEELCRGTNQLIVPVLALNEVFLGEIVSAKVSYFEMQLNGDRESAKVKSSGLCVCTGTGSTSWHMSINRLSTQAVRGVLELYKEVTKDTVRFDLVSDIRDSFNSKFRFSPEENILGYTIRDLISAGVWPNPKGLIQPRGHVRSMSVLSKCSEAGLVIDGGISYPFNDGTVAILETHSQDALKTVQLR